MTSTAVIYFFESVGLFMGLYFLLQFIVLKKREYLHYSIYLLLLVIYYLCAIPELFFRSPVGPGEINYCELFKRPVQFMISVFYTLFIMEYLNLKKQSLPLYRIFRFLLVMYTVFALGCFLGNLWGFDYNNIYYYGSIVLFPVQLYMVTALFKYKVPYGRFVIWGSINVIVGSVLSLCLGIYAAMHPGGAVSNAVSYIPVVITILVDIFLFTIALQRKIADNEKSLVHAAIARQQAVSQERERIITDLHDDVGGGLSSIRMMSDLMTQQEGSAYHPGGQLSFASKISATARDISQRMNTIIWSLNMENDSLQNFAEYVRQYGVAFFEDSNTEFIYKNEPSPLPAKQLTGGQRKNLFLIVKEALNNVLKHANAQKVIVAITLENNQLEITVTDDGQGMLKDNNFGNGLKNMEKRMKEIQGQFQIHSNHGTIITIGVLLP
jgi:signal transduction histidine kinase